MQRLTALNNGKAPEKPKAPVKYRGPNGDTWSRRGSRPKFPEDHLAKGGKLENLSAIFAPVSIAAHRRRILGTEVGTRCGLLVDSSTVVRAFGTAWAAGR